MLFTIQCKKTLFLYEKTVAFFGALEKISFFHGLKDWNSPTKNQKILIGNVFPFFAASDGLVNENLAENFLQEMQLPEEHVFYSFQILLEHIHSAYLLLIYTYIQTTTEQNSLLRAILRNVGIARKTASSETIERINDVFRQFYLINTSK